MNILEQKLIDELERQKPYFRKLIEEKQPEHKVMFALIIDGVFDSVLYDPELDKFTKITYSIGKGNCDLSINDGSGLFEEVEYKEIDLINMSPTL